ncbi:hypothetical protein B0T21DRAFT_412447 [Apiosordaria backusii]|uniref:Myb-like domain-containing protein n=1 Tax=Apiosordaria backusii TaxID=314023 RepID=A0AA40BKI3_9PEZI|nr:hypothetical protein B0T21DRAFT_412447 [Apiosordaria backusii]
MPIRSLEIDSALIDPELLSSDYEREEPELHEFDDAGDREYAPSDVSSDYDTQPRSDHENNEFSQDNHNLPLDQPSPSHRRKRSLSASSPRPLKRHKPPPPFRPAYLELLNEDIVSAATKFIPPPPSYPQLDPSQHGLTYWSETEKVLLFETLTRLGPSNPLAISHRLKTKSELEVSAYLSLLQSSSSAEDPTPISDIPAALELSPALCLALEAASDAVATKQLTHEESIESAKWGPNHWLITPHNLEYISQENPHPKMLFLPLFRLRTWLKLSERIFMNSTVEDYNYHSFLSEEGRRRRAEEREKPGIRATALEDFYSLVVSYTRRLIATSIFMAEERISQKKLSAQPDVRNVIWKKDVKAALLSLNIPYPAERQRERFWGEAARRLRLDVMDDEAPSAVFPQDEKQPLSYSAVEASLGLDPTHPTVTSTPQPEADGDEGSSVYKEETETEKEGDGDGGGGGDDNESEYSDVYDEFNSETAVEKRAVLEEAEEVLRYSAVEYPDTKRSRLRLRHVIRAERAREAYADEMDGRASWAEEKRLWGLLGQKPPEGGLGKVEDLEKTTAAGGMPGRGGKVKTVGELIGGFDRGAGKDRLEGERPSNWEMEYAVLKEQEKERAKVGLERLRNLNNRGDHED